MGWFVCNRNFVCAGSVTDPYLRHTYLFVGSTNSSNYQGDDMSRQRDRKERRSLARQRAETHASGYETTLLRMPEGLRFWEVKEGTIDIAIVPYICGEGNPFAPKGEEYYERTFWMYKRVGPDEKPYVCPSKSFGKTDYIKEELTREMKNPNADKDYIKTLQPKERQLFLVYEVENPEKGIFLWETSYHLFGKLLDSRVKNSRDRDGWDQFYFPDEDGFDLRLTIEKVSSGGYSFLEVTAIDFMPRREPIPKEIAEHEYCLDDMLICPSYEDLKKAFLGADVFDDGGDDDSEDASRSNRGRTRSREKEDDSQSSRSRSSSRSRDRDNDSDDGDRKSRSRQEKDDDSDRKGGEGRKKSSSKPITAEEAGLEEGDLVKYKGENCEIVRISGDGTSLTLMDSNDEPIRAVGCDEVRKASGRDTSRERDPEPRKEKDRDTGQRRRRDAEESSRDESPPFDKEDEKASSSGDDDDDWDFD